MKLSRDKFNERVITLIKKDKENVFNIRKIDSMTSYTYINDNKQVITLYVTDEPKLEDSHV